MARFVGTCGGAEAVTASFDQEMTVDVYVKNKGDCDVRINLSVLAPEPGLPLPALKSLGKKKVESGSSATFSRDGVTDVRIYCLGEDDDRDCRFRYTIDAS